MRYHEDAGHIALSIGELVSISLHRYASEIVSEREQDIVSMPQPAHLPRDIGEARCFSHTFTEGGHRFLLTGEATGVQEAPVGLMGSLPRLTLARQTDGDPQNPDKDSVRRIRGELFGLCFLYLANNPAAQAVTGRIFLCNPQRGSDATHEEMITRKAAESFFTRLCACLGKQASEEVDRVSRRLPTLDKLTFPYSARRDSQEQMIQAAYRAIKHGRRLYACAPTGTGKTAAALYPALRALGAGLCDRVFYLTPKTTTARAAAEALARFAHAGGRLRAICLAAKERLCTEKMACRELPSPCRFSRAGGAREEAAAEALLLSPAVPITEREIILLRYFKNLTQTETGRALNLTQVTVSRKEAKAIELLRSALK